jgi:hypothetical protein
MGITVKNGLIANILIFFSIIIFSTFSLARVAEDQDDDIGGDALCMKAINSAKHYPINYPVVNDGKVTTAVIGADRNNKSGVYAVTDRGDVKWFQLNDNRDAELYFESADGTPHKVFGSFSASNDNGTNKYQLNDYEFSTTPTSKFKNATVANGLSLERKVEIPDQEARDVVDKAVEDAITQVSQPFISNADIMKSQIKSIDDEIKSRGAGAHTEYVAERKSLSRLFDPTRMSDQELVSAKQDLLKSLKTQQGYSAATLASDRAKFQKALDVCRDKATDAVKQFISENYSAPGANTKPVPGYGTQGK